MLLEFGSTDEKIEASMCYTFPFWEIATHAAVTVVVLICTDQYSKQHLQQLQLCAQKPVLLLHVTVCSIFSTMQKLHFDNGLLGAVFTAYSYVLLIFCACFILFFLPENNSSVIYNFQS